MDLILLPPTSVPNDRAYPDLEAAYAWGDYLIYKCFQFVPRTGQLIERLIIERRDREPIASWGDLQTIKDLVLGRDRVAVQVFPKSSEVVDQGNLYHLWSAVEGATLTFVPRVATC